jgi:hypothetical protein
MATKQPQLPLEILPSSTKLIQIILTLLCPWLVFALANVGANLYLQNFPANRGYWVIQQKWSILMNLKQPVDWLVLGDSSCNQGVVPEVLEAELSGKAVNLCTIGDSLILNDAWMLSKYIKKYGAPKNILLVHVYDVWQREINWDVTSQTPLSWGYWNQLEPNFDLSFQEKKKVFLNRYVPLYSQNTSLKEVVRNSDRLFEDKEYYLDQNGFMKVTEANIGNVEEDTKGHINDIRKTTFSFSQTNQKSMDAIIKLAEKHDINVYLVNSPLYEKLYQNPEFQTYYNRVQKELVTISDRSKQIELIMTQPMTFKKEEMENADHLILSAAESYTKELAREIKLISK